MVAYRYIAFGPGGRIADVRDIDAETDSDAMIAVEKQRADESGELWQAKRLVTAYPPECP